MATYRITGSANADGGNVATVDVNAVKTTLTQTLSSKNLSGVREVGNGVQSVFVIICISQRAPVDDAVYRADSRRYPGSLLIYYTEGSIIPSQIETGKQLTAAYASNVAGILDAMKALVERLETMKDLVAAMTKIRQIATAQSITTPADLLSVIGFGAKGTTRNNNDLGNAINSLAKAIGPEGLNLSTQTVVEAFQLVA